MTLFVSLSVCVIVHYSIKHTRPHSTVSRRVLCHCPLCLSNIPLQINPLVTRLGSQRQLLLSRLYHSLQTPIVHKTQLGRHGSRTDIGPKEQHGPAIDEFGRWHRRIRCFRHDVQKDSLDFVGVFPQHGLTGFLVLLTRVSDIDVLELYKHCCE